MNLKVHMKINYLNQIFNIHVKRKKIEIHRNLIMMNLIWPILGNSKVHNFFLLRFF